MISSPDSSQIFSFHSVQIPITKLPQFLMNPIYKKKVEGLNYSESFFTMNLGEPIYSPPRYNLKSVGFFAWWSDESYMDQFMSQSQNKFLNTGWHVRMKLYRKWGEVNELKDANVSPHLVLPDKPIVAVTLARLNLSQTLRFIKWGRPVENQVRDHKGKILAFAAMRPLNTFSTFSVWKNETEMTNMVNGKNKIVDGLSHTQAMKERVRKDFHKEFMTMRFVPVKEVGTWQGHSNYIDL